MNITVLEESEVAEIFRFYLNGIIDGLNIKRCEISTKHSDPIKNAIKTFENYLSIIKLKEGNSEC